MVLLHSKTLLTCKNATNCDTQISLKYYIMVCHGNNNMAIKTVPGQAHLMCIKRPFKMFFIIVIHCISQLLLKLFKKNVNFQRAFIINFIIGVGTKEKLF